MATLIILLPHNAGGFWGSETGCNQTEAFLDAALACAKFERRIVVGGHQRILDAAQRRQMARMEYFGPASEDGLYAFEYMRNLAQEARRLGAPGQIVVADSRNIFLTPGDLLKGLDALIGEETAIAVSVVQPRDPPIQWNAYALFKGAGILQLVPGDCSEKTVMGLECDSALAFRVEGGMVYCRLAAIPPPLGLRIRAQQLAWDPGECHITEFELVEPERWVVCGSAPIQDADFLVVASAPSEENYDTIEHFDPPAAPWSRDLGTGIPCNVATRKPMLGRQDFPPVFVFDNSFCAFGKDSQDTPKREARPVVLDRSAIVSDWLDYWSVQAGSTKKET